MLSYRKSQGLTLIELMMTVAVLGLMAALASVSYETLINKKRVKQATEVIYSDLKFAHSESIKRQSNIYVSFKSGTAWCYGIDDTAACDCSTANDCQIDGVEKVINSTDFSGTSLALTGFTTGGGEVYVQYEGIRGVASDSGSLTITRMGKSATVKSNKIGLIENCSNDLVTYNICP